MFLIPVSVLIGSAIQPKSLKTKSGHFLLFWLRYSKFYSDPVFVTFAFQHFPVDITSYLEDAGTIHGEKVLTVVFGMDCVPHDEIVPYRTHITRPIVHNLFGGLFECTAVEDNGDWLLLT